MTNENELKEIEELAIHLWSLFDTNDGEMKWDYVSKHTREFYVLRAKNLITEGYVRHNADIPERQGEFTERDLRHFFHANAMGHEYFGYHNAEELDKLAKLTFQRFGTVNQLNSSVAEETQKLWDNLIFLTKKMEEREKTLQKRLKEISSDTPVLSVEELENVLNDWLSGAGESRLTPDEVIEIATAINQRMKEK